DPQRQKRDPAPQREVGRQGAGLPHLRGPDRVRRRLEEDLPRETGIPLGQTGRPQLPGADLRLAGRDRGRAQPDLVPLNRKRRRALRAAAPSSEKSILEEAAMTRPADLARPDIYARITNQIIVQL